MTEYTTRLGLYKPGGGGTGTNLPDEAADIDRLNQNFDAIDAAVGIPRVTSTTHPLHPWPGMMIYEIDTGDLLSWDEIGFNWVSVLPVIPPSTATLVVGDTHLWPGNDDPPEFLVPLDGRSLAVSSYTALAAVHPEWIVGSNIVLPDWRNRFVVGAGDDYDPGHTGGATSLTHSHTLSDAGAAQIQVAAQANTAVYIHRTGSIESWNSTHRTSNASGGSSTAESTTSGAALMGSTDDASVSNLPPYVAGTWCVCVASTIGEYDPVVQAALVTDVADHENRINDLEDVMPGTDGHPYAEAAGVVVTNSGSLTNGSGANIAVTFPSGRFTEAPIVTVTISGSSRLNVAANSVTTSGFTVRVDNFSGGTAGASSAYWHAIQMESGSASG